MERKHHIRIVCFMRKEKLLFLSLLIIIISSANLYGRDVIEVLAFEYPPIYQNREDPGLSCEIVVAAFNAVDIEVNLRFLPVVRMIRMLAEGEAICAIGGTILFEEPEVSKAVEISSVVQYVVQTFIYDSRRYPEGISYDHLSDMTLYEIGVLNGSGIMRFLEKTTELRLHANTRHEGTAKQLHQRRVDVWAIVDLTGIMYLNKLYPSEAHHYHVTEPYHFGDVSAVFSKIRDSENYYNNQFKQGLDIIKKNGTYLEIMAKYYGGRDRINPYTLSLDMRQELNQ